MPKKTLNPFNVTKSVNLSDQEINDYWVDITDGRGFVEMVKPTSPMPMFLLGGKGSGKTHLMRYFSFPLQSIRHRSGGAVYKGVEAEGYLGIYMRCSGLNAARFKNKKQSEDVWNDVFAYHLEIWLAQLLVETACNALSAWHEMKGAEPQVVAELLKLFDVNAGGQIKSLAEVRHFLRSLQEEIDVAVNNCSLTGGLDLKIRTTVGRLVFGVPQAFARHFEPLSDCLFLYLLDEFENLSLTQQKHINTLLREKAGPCTFKIGARLYGVKTFSTYSDDEDIKEGSEFELLRLDERLRRNPNYKTFAKGIVNRRLCEHGYPFCNESSRSKLETSFDVSAPDELATGETAFVRDKYFERERPYFSALKANLNRGIRVRHAPGLATPEDINYVIDLLRRPDYPLLEKTNCFLFYQAWSGTEDLRSAAKSINEGCDLYIGDRRGASKYAETLNHFRADLLAQLRKDCDQKQRYLGMDTFIEMSSGLPRILLIVLKHVFDWAIFLGEEPFGDRPISADAQVKGVKDAADWFFRDARMTGNEGRVTQEAVNRLATLFRGIRYSDKPSECSVLAFSYEASRVNDRAYGVLKEAVQWSLLLEVGVQRDRNSDRVDQKIQLNRMLAPRWDLPVGSRGAIALSGEEVDAIFDPALSEEFDRLMKVRIDRMMAPLFGRKGAEESGSLLPGFDDV